MIFIFSKSKFEGTTDEVIDWLVFLGGSFERVNGIDFFKKTSFESNSGQMIERIEQAKACWFRRWMDDDFFKELFRGVTISYENKHTLENHLHREFSLLSNELWRRLSNRKWITKPSEVVLKKIEVLNAASNCKLLVPPSIVTTNKNELILFKKRNGRIISKTIGDVPNFQDKGLGFSLRTIEIQDSCIDQLAKTFFPSLFQALIEKEFELRIFFLYDKFYTMAIFSQSDKQTELDFRNYNREKPNRTTCFKLPILLEKKLLKLVKSLGLTTGSIDMIRQRGTGDFYFLEINPVGQIGMTSYPCNYYLEREIAKQLINNDR